VNDSDAKKDDCSAGSLAGSQIGCSGEYSDDCLVDCSDAHSGGCSVWPTAAPNVTPQNELAMHFVTPTNDPLIGSATDSAKHARQTIGRMIHEKNDQTNALSIQTMSVSATPQQKNQRSPTDSMNPRDDHAIRAPARTRWRRQTQGSRCP